MFLIFFVILLLMYCFQLRGFTLKTENKTVKTAFKNLKTDNKMAEKEITEKKPFRFNPESKQFGARLSTDEVNYLNDNLSYLLPEGIDSRTLTAADVLLHMAEKTITKVKIQRESQPADLAKIAALEKEVAEYKALQTENVANAERLQNEVESLEYIKETAFDKIELLNSTIAELQSQLAEKETDVTAVLSKLENATAPNPRRVVIDLTPGQFAVTEAFRAKLSQSAKREVTIPQMLFDLFWNYVTKQLTQIAFPFYYSKSQIQQLIKGAE